MSPLGLCNSLGARAEPRRYTFIITTAPAARAVCPVRVLKIVEGAWCDDKVMRDVPLTPRGPVYVMDRRFAAFALFEQ